MFLCVFCFDYGVGHGVSTLMFTGYGTQQRYTESYDHGSNKKLLSKITLEQNLYCAFPLGKLNNRIKKKKCPLSI